MELARRLSVNEGEIGLEIGTGSGICAICGAKKGAKRIVAADINMKVKNYFDFNTILNNVEDNVEDKVEFILGDVYGDIGSEKFNLTCLPIPLFLLLWELVSCTFRYL